MAMRPSWVRQLSPKAIAAGAAVDIVATNVAIIPILIPILIDPKWQGMSAAAQSVALTNLFATKPSLYLSGLILGSICSILGGWVAARMTCNGEVLNGAMSAVLCVGFGIYGLVEYPNVIPLWQHGAFFVLSPALGAFGGVIRLRQVRAKPNKPSLAAPDQVTPVIEPVPISGVQRLLYIANRGLIVVSLLIALFFVVVGLYGRSRGENAVVVGSIFIMAAASAAAILYQLAARDLRRGFKRHWALHAGALGLTSLPFLLAAAVL